MIFPRDDTTYTFEIYLGSNPTKIQVPLNLGIIDDNEILFRINNENKVLEYGEDLSVSFFGN